MLTHKQLRSAALKNSAVKEAYEELAPEYEVLDKFLKARSARGLTQAQVAAQMGTTQSAVARMETGQGKHSPTLATLTKYAEALGCRLEFKLVRQPVGKRNLTLRSSGIGAKQPRQSA